MPNVKLGRDQTITLDGNVLLGTRDIDIDIDTKTVEATAWDHEWVSTLPLAVDATVKLLIYWGSDYANFASKLNKHPPEPMTLAITNCPSVRCVPVKVGIKVPLPGVLAWEVTLKLFAW